MTSHLTRQDLLAYLDGELPKREMGKAATHLQSCWTCRAELKRLEGDILTILDAQNDLLLPAQSQPPRPWLSFDTLLARNLPSDSFSLRNRLAAYIDPPFGHAWLLMASICLIALVVFTYSIFRSTPVSAKEVLRQVYLADRTRTSIVRDQVLRERVHIRKRTRRQSAPQPEELDVWKSKTATYWDLPGGDSAGAGLEAEYKAYDVPMNLPLSAASVDDWSKVVGGSPTISRQGEDLNLSFASAAAGSIERVSWLIQPQTWQVKQMTLQFPDASFEVTEDNLSVLPIGAVPANLVAHLEPEAVPEMLVRHSAKQFSGSVVNSVHLQALDLDAVELDVLATLHYLNADLGEPVTVTRSSQEVLVGIWELPDGRQRQLSAALQDKPGVQVQTAAPASLAVSRNVSPENPLSPPLRIAADLVDGDPRLAKFFGSAEREEAYTREALAASTTILSHLYALRSLQEQFPPQREKALASGARAQLMTLVEDHAGAATAGVTALRSQLEPLNAAFNIPSIGLPENLPASTWQGGSLNALETAKGIDHWLRCLLATTETPVSADSALPQIQRSLPRLSAELENLSMASR